MTFSLLACGKDITAPDPLPHLLQPGEGVIRFTLSSNCPSPLTIAFEMDIFLYGPETLAPGQHQDFAESAGVHVTGAYSFPDKLVRFPKENTTVVAGQRVIRVLSC